MTRSNTQQGVRRGHRTLALLAAGAMAALLAACGGDGGGDKLNLVAYSTPQEAYEELIPAFNKTPDGTGVSFNQSYGASGDQARAIESGLAADVAAFAIQSDMTKLVDAGKVSADWDKGKYKGIVTNSVVSFVVRKGNPKNIKTWDDLTKEGVEVIHPNPFSSGGARWNIMAAYGAQLEQGKSPEEALAFLKKEFENVPVQDKSAREALQTFIGGKGDVLVSYENEAITAQQKGEDVDYVIPPETILIENPIAVTSDSKKPTQAKSFVDYLFTEPAQQIYASKGYRSVIPSVVDKQKFPEPQAIYTIDDLGGWDKITEEFFNPETGKFAVIEKELGVSTAK